MVINVPDTHLLAAKEAAKGIEADVFLFNSELRESRDLDLINLIAENKSRDAALLLLTTNGGDPDGAYRIARYFQENYQRLTILIAGRCKSAGTLIALGASELAFMPYGELGPLDIQLTKVDKFDGAQSGLAIQDAINTLESRATEAFFEIVKGYMDANQGLLSFSAATKAGSDFITQLYAPVLARIDPEEVGAKTRSMRIADDYGKRLSIKWQNVKPGAVKKLAETYSSHSFVIDKREAETLFINVRSASDAEREMVNALGFFARFQVPSDHSALHVLSSRLEAEEQDHAANDVGGEPENGGNPEGTGATPELASPSPRQRQHRTVQPAE